MTGEKDSTVVTEPQPGGRAPAPGELALVQAFMNTRWDLASERHSETFVNAAALHAWLQTRRLIQGSTRLTSRDLDRVLALREGLRALAFVNNGHRCDDGALEAMRRASEGVAVEIHIGPDGPRFVADGSKGIGGAVGALLAIAARAMIDGSWQRLKACPGRHCGWTFYDHSRNQSGRWCSMKLCGDRDKARAYYQRQTTRQAGTKGRKKSRPPTGRDGAGS